jgi:ABC-type polysaccharide/polyol phosphate export permease
VLRRWRAHGIGDWSASFRLWRLWTALGLEDLSDRYRRTLFGISWVATSFAAFVFVKIAVFGQMTSIPREEFALFVTIGFGLWSFINAVVCEACTAYTGSGNWIKGSSVPYPVFILQVAYRNWLVFALILLVVMAVLLWKKHAWPPVALAARPPLIE